MPTIVLASTSPFRAQLLERLGLPFQAAAPNADETALAEESAEQLVIRLAEAKARAVQADHPNALIIGSDQVAVLDGNILGKPGTHERAVGQLSSASGKSVRFLTGLCLLDTRNDEAQVDMVPFEVKFRQLDAKQIDYYLRAEKPYNAAGSFKSEAMGIALFESMNGNDPTALVGLPLIRLTSMLAEAGVDVLAP